MHKTHSLAGSHHHVAIIGGGQAGLSLSYYLKQAGVDHVVIEKNQAMGAWRTQRWDAFCLVTPNWQCALPGYPYQGNDPHGFMVKNQILDYLDGFARHVNAPLVEGVAVTRVNPRPEGGFAVDTAAGNFTADQVVVASGGYHEPIIPRMAERLPKAITQLHSAQYRSPERLPEGAVLVVGSGQSGAQIAEDLHLAGRKVFLATGDAPRCARFYRGKDVVDWLAEMGYYEMPVHEHPLKEGVRDNTNHYVTGRDGGRDIDLRKFALEGMELYGKLVDGDGQVLEFAPDLAANLAHGDKIYNGINTSIDMYIAEKGIDAPPGEVYQPVWEPDHERVILNLESSGISTIIWCIGFRPDFTWVQAPVFDGRGNPGHVRGVTRQPGLYFLGLPWLYTWGSGRFSGVARDAAFLAERIVAHAQTDQAIAA
ncbi:MAG: MSMEG_0569 family flavin-dependent oxidoreductase [Zoogloeaceae bacterium]|nr:MSMEG_0569 family flavin-dependent oxidoreductase [Zoogloeaceae bacterium]